MVAHALNLSIFGGRNRKISAFKASLVYLKRSGMVRTTQRRCLKQTKLSRGVIPKSGLTLRPASLKGKRKEGLVHLGWGEGSKTPGQEGRSQSPRVHTSSVT